MLAKPSHLTSSTDHDIPQPKIFGSLCIVMVRVFANGQGDSGFNPASRHTKASKMVFDASLLNTLHYNIRIKGK